MKNMLIKYTFNEEKQHVDPNFTFLTYGDSGNRGVQIKNALTPGSYVFFHTSYDKKEYLTAYFYVEKILTKESHKAQIDNLKTDSKFDDVVIIGSREHSKVLTHPLPFNRRVVENLTSLNINWNKVESGEQSELKTISDSTRTHRLLTGIEIDWLINECLFRG